MAKFVIFHGSPRKNGTSTKLAKMLAEELTAAGAEVKVYDLNTPGIKGCQGCDVCRARQDCIQKDYLQPMYQDIRECDGVVFSSPIYMTGITGQAKIGLDRMYPFFDIRLKPRLPGKRAVCIITQADSTETKFYDGIAQVAECFEMFGWDQIEPIVCYGTGAPGFEIPQEILDQVKETADILLKGEPITYRSNA